MGVGHELMKGLVEIAIARSCLKIEWLVPNGTRVIQFYERDGAMVLDERYRYRLDENAIRRLNGECGLRGPPTAGGRPCQNREFNPDMGENLFDCERSQTAEAAMEWLEGMASALDRTARLFKGEPVLGSATAVDAFVYTKRRLPRERDQRGEEQERERSLIDDSVAHLYEQPREWSVREKRRWRQLIQGPGKPLAVRGAPGGGKTFLTRNEAVRMARESAEAIRLRKAPLDEVPVPSWIDATSLAEARGSSPAKLVVNASRRSLARFEKDLPAHPLQWLEQPPVRLGH